VDGANTIASGSAGLDITGVSFPAGGTVSCVNVGTNDNNLIATFSNFGVSNVWVSTNAGTSWTAIDGDLPDMPVRWAIFYPGDNTKAILATEMGIYETALISAGATSWTHNATFPTVRTDMLQFRSSDRLLAAATHGRGLWTTTIPSVLPVTLLNFSGLLNKDKIDLSWSTASEQNSKYFDLQKSEDGTNYHTITKMDAAGNSSSRRDYNFADGQVSEYNYYRLKMVDIDGKFVYSRTILIKDPSAAQQVWVMNNPFTNLVKLKMAKIPKQQIDCEIVNIAGLRVFKEQFNPATELSLNIRSQLPTGSYFLRVKVDGRAFSFKLIKE
jgi:hypothetical protein